MHLSTHLHARKVKAASVFVEYNPSSSALLFLSNYMGIYNFFVKMHTFMSAVEHSGLRLVSCMCPNVAIFFEIRLERGTEIVIELGRSLHNCITEQRPAVSALRFTVKPKASSCRTGGCATLT